MKRIFSLLIAMCLIFSILPSNSYAIVGNFDRPVTFMRSGRVITLVKDFNSYYLMRETFDTDGSYVENVIKEELSESQYRNELSKKAYDILYVKEIASSINGNLINEGGGRSYFVNYLKDNNDVTSANSFIANITSEYNSYLSFVDFKSKLPNPHAFLYKDNNRFFRCNENSVTGIITMTPIDQATYDLMKMDMVTNMISYIREVDYLKDGNGKAHYSDIVYDENNNQILTLINDAIEIDKTFSEIEGGEVFNDNSAPIENEGENSFDGSRYNEKYLNWNDEFNEGYMGSWQDPSYMGVVKTIDWEDPFWLNSDIDQSRGNEQDNVTSGYYDDEGTFIPTDAYGNPIPSIPGQFDSSGNFKPDGVDGYYDPDGIFHPLFNKIQNIGVGSDSSINIDDLGYIDKYGLWHGATKEFDTIYLYNSKKILPNGILLNENNEYEAVLMADMWGNFYYNDLIIYKNGSILNKADLSLIKTDGTILEHQITDYGNYIYTDGTIILKDTFALGTKVGDIEIELINGSKIYETGAIYFPNDISYDNGTIGLDNSEIIEASFDNGVIDLGSYGKIYSNGHYAEYNEFGDLITDNDCVILNDDMVLLENGYILNSNGYITSTYQDDNLNIITVNGLVINRELEIGAYDDNGNFIEGLVVDNGFYYDRLGNKVNSDGSVIKDEIFGFYNENFEFEEGLAVNLDFYYTCDGNKVFFNGTTERKANVNGYYDENNNFYMNNGKNYYDSNGTKFSITKKRNYYINNNGSLVDNRYSDFVINMDGTISILGASGNYVGDGLFKVNNNIGYYDEYGRFVISNQNIYLSDNGFYDANQKWHNNNEVYKDINDNLKLLRNPNLGLKVIDEDHIGFTYNELSFTKNGITEINNQKGYYNSNGKFVVSNNSPYKGGFYTEGGQWIDSSYYLDEFGNIYVNNGKYIYNGNYITPSGDIGYFNENKDFILGKKCIYEDFFYDSEGNMISDDIVFLDKLGIYKTFNRNIAVNMNGNQLDIDNSREIIIDGYTYLYLGLFANADGLIGYFDKDGNFINSSILYSNGFYLPDKTFISNKEIVNYGYYTFYPNKNILEASDDGIWLYTPDGYSLPLYKDDITIIFSDGTELDENGERVFDDSDIENKFWIMDKYYIDTTDDSGYYIKEGTFYKNDGTFGYYNSEGEYQENKNNIYMNGFYIKSKEWVGYDGYIPNEGYFNRYGISRNGSNPNLDGYYDEEGSWHVFDRKIYIELNGNAHILSDDAIGYYDYDNNLHLYGEKGWFNSDGTYIVDNAIMGYYTITGDLKRGQNTSFEGFYDMHGRWYKFGSDGYYSNEGKFVESVNGEAIGYYNSVGEFNYGYNLYLTGYYGFNGEWNNPYTDPVTMYYNVNGISKLGQAPYYNGFYDMYGNWYLRGEKGYFDKHGTYYNIVSDDTGYYDAKGIYYEGTNPFVHGYYDPDKNLRLFGQEGHFDSTGTYIDTNGEKWYFLNGGIKQKSQNPNLDGFYDMHGNWYNFGDTGYYNPEGTFYDFLIEVSAYKVGSSDYILFEGVFKNIEYVSEKIRNTIQFSVLGNKNNVKYVDTGIKVPTNAMISYDKAKDVLHSISIYNTGTFIEDNDSCILIFDGNIISLKNEGKVSIRELKNMFLDCDIDLVVAISRVGSRFTMTDLIESGNEINIYHNDKKMVMKNPLIVRNGIGYIAIEDIKDLFMYNLKIEGENNKEVAKFEIKNSALLEKYYNAYETIEIPIDSNVYYTKLKDDFVQEKKSSYNQIIAEKLNEDDTKVVYYIAIKDLETFIDKYVQLDTINYNIEFKDLKTQTPIVDSY